MIKRAQTIRRYYSSRTKTKSLTVGDLYWKLQNLFLLFQSKDYFKGKAGITQTRFPDAIKHEAAVALTFQPFPIAEWSQDDITEDHIFDVSSVPTLIGVMFLTY